VERKLSWRDHLRAGLIALHMAALLIMCLPVPGKLGPGRLKEPGFQAQLRSWRSVGRSVGVKLSQEEAVAMVVRIADVMREVRHKSVKVVKPYIRRVGAGQAWQMFGVVQTDPGILRVELYEGGAWRDLFRHGDPNADWMGRFMYSERGRALLNQYAYRSRQQSYERFGSWLACRAHAEHPEATKLRTTIQVLELVGPQKLRELGTLPIDSTRWERTYDLHTCGADTP
jgi:hypothetical protein